MRDIVRGTDGAVLQSYDYKENGDRTTVNGSGPQSAKTWVGGLSVNDDVGDSGLYLMGHRHYDPSLGRFLSQDPIGFVGGLNLYEYASSSPVTMLDALGLQTTSIMPATPEQEILQGFQKIGTGAVITQGIPLLIGPDDVVGGAVIASGVKDVARGTVRYALGRISGAVSAPQEDRRRRKDDEFFERYGCEDEAVASDAANQLLQRAGHPNAEKWVAEIGQQDWKRLGKYKKHDWRMTIRARKGARAWLQVNTHRKSNEPWAYGIPAHRLGGFNSYVVEVTATSARK